MSRTETDWVSSARLPLASRVIQWTVVVPRGKRSGASLVVGRTNGEVVPKLSRTNGAPSATPRAPPGALHSAVTPAGAARSGGVVSATTTASALKEEIFPTTAFLVVSGFEAKLQHGSSRISSMLAVASTQPPPVKCRSLTSASLAPSRWTADST